VRHEGSAHQPLHHAEPKDGQGHGRGRLRDSQEVLANLLEEEQQLVGGQEGIVPTQQAKYESVRYGLRDIGLVVHTIRLLRFAFTPPKPAGSLFRFECDPCFKVFKKSQKSKIIKEVQGAGNFHYATPNRFLSIQTKPKALFYELLLLWRESL